MKLTTFKVNLVLCKKLFIITIKWQVWYHNTNNYKLKFILDSRSIFTSPI